MATPNAAPLPAAALVDHRHPPGLFLLFFVEMWERFSYYGMRALLVFYMIKGFLQYGDNRAYAVYGAYGALVYATPFLGGLFADRYLGPRVAVIWGGALMAAGHLLMTVEQEWAFFGALALLICGNGFFKPNISTMVGALYPKGSPKRDAGFTIFYMGINLGAALAPLLVGYIGETYGWHYGFGLATIGMITGLATFVMPRGVAQLMIMATALLAALGMLLVGANDRLMLIINAPLVIALVIAAIAATRALGKGGLPHEVGRHVPRPDQSPAALRLARWAIFGGTILAIPVIALLVRRDEWAGYALMLFGGLALLSLLYAAIQSAKVERERLFVVLILMFFSMLFWAFFEQAGSSVNNFTDRNVDRVVGDASPTPGTAYERVVVTQEFLGQSVAGKTWTLDDIESAQKARLEAIGLDPATEIGTVNLTIAAGDERQALLGIGGTELKASIFQAANPTFILAFGLVFSMLWGWMGARGIEPSTPVKFALGLVQLGMGFGAFWLGATQADSMGMVAMSWLLLGYLLQTTGELCLSPVGLSMVTRLSPARMVSTVMGAWFLATAFSNYLAGIIAQFTGVGEGGGEKTIPPPWETVGVYGSVFGQIAIAAAISGVIVWAMSPLLNRWMHTKAEELEGGH